MNSTSYRQSYLVQGVRDIETGRTTLEINLNFQHCRKVFWHIAGIVS